MQIPFSKISFDYLLCLQDAGIFRNSLASNQRKLLNDHVNEEIILMKKALQGLNKHNIY